MKIVRRAIEVDINEVLDKRELHLSNHEKNILREFVDIFEPFENATDILQGEEYASICLVVPTYVGLMRNLDNFKEKAKHCRGIITSLAASLETRLGHVTTESLFCIQHSLIPTLS